MVKVRNMELYQDVFNYIQNHTYLETSKKFNISEMQIARIKKYMLNQSAIINKNIQLENIIQREKKIQVEKPEFTSRKEPLRVVKSSKIESRVEIPEKSKIEEKTISITRLMTIYELLTNKSIRKPKNEIIKGIKEVLSQFK